MYFAACAVRSNERALSLSHSLKVRPKLQAAPQSQRIFSLPEMEQQQLPLQMAFCGHCCFFAIAAAAAAAAFMSIHLLSVSFQCVSTTVFRSVSFECRERARQVLCIPQFLLQARIELKFVRECIPSCHTSFRCSSRWQRQQILGNLMHKVYGVVVSLSIC